jgi:hypothetical protein
MQLIPNGSLCPNSALFGQGITAVMPCPEQIKNFSKSSNPMESIIQYLKDLEVVLQDHVRVSLSVSSGH